MDGLLSCYTKSKSTMTPRLPTEILQDIFGLLDGKDLIACRDVCTQWRDAADGACDKLWRKVCSDHSTDSHYIHAHRKSSISWRDLFMSIELWKDVAETNVQIKKIPVKRVPKFKILKDSTLSCPQSREKTLPGYDCIVYYDLITLEESGKELFDFKFDNYEETDNLLILGFVRQGYNMIRIIPKTEKEHFLELYDVSIGYNPWMRQASLVHYMGPIIELHNEKAVLVDYFPITNVDHVTSYGNGIINGNIVRVHDMETAETNFRHGKLLIVVSRMPPGLLHFIYNPYNKKGRLKRRRLTPDKTIDMKTLVHGLKKEELCKPVFQVDVIEIVNGHKVIALYCGKLYVIELSHDDPIETAVESSESLFRCVVT